MVNSRPYRANGPMRGMKRSSYQVRPLAFSPIRRDRNPASRGMPRKMSTDRAMSQMEASMVVWSRPSQPGSRFR